VTFSLLPDCLPSRFGGTLSDLEQVVVLQEAIGTEAAANHLRSPEEPDAVTLVSAVRWVRRRSRLVHAGLRSLIGLFPELFVGIEPTVMAVRVRLGVLLALEPLRQIAASHLHALPSPLGFGPRPQRRWIRPGYRHHSTGPDPP
jgi:hypothetical protein